MSVTTNDSVFGAGATHSSRESAPREPTLEGLAHSRVADLGDLYGAGTPPRLRDLDGTPRGRMLAMVGPLGRDRAFEALRRFARSGAFPWAGKSFRTVKDDRGEGVNRVRLAGNLFKFETRIGPSAVDGGPCLILDYDLSSNPWFIRKIHDELRQVGPRLYLGPAMWKTADKPVLVLYFAIAT